MGKVIAVCSSEKKGTRKRNIGSAILKENWGLVGDAHAGDWHRQVSLLAEESILKMKAKGLELEPGDFAENLTVRGLDLPSLPVGTKLVVGDGVVLEVTQIGKECHHGCAIYQQVGECIMPREGIFARVLKGGKVKVGDRIEVKQVV